MEFRSIIFDMIPYLLSRGAVQIRFEKNHARLKPSACRIIQFFGQTMGMLVVDAFCRETGPNCL